LDGYPARKWQCEVPLLKKLQHDFSVERIIAEVAKAGNVRTDDLRNQKTKLKDLSQMALDSNMKTPNDTNRIQRLSSIYAHKRY
jgi:hypothetical protein